MILAEVYQAIRKLYEDTGVVTGFNKSYGSPEFFKIVCQNATMLEADIIYFTLRAGAVFDATAKARLSHLKRLACTP